MCRSSRGPAGKMCDVVRAASGHLPAHGWRGLLVAAGLVMAVALTAAGCSQPAANGAVVQCGTANVHASGGGHDVEIPEGGTATLTLPIGETVRVSGSGACGASIRLAAQVPGASPERFDQIQSLTYTVSTPTTKIAVLWTPCVPPASGPAPACPLTQYGILVLHSPGSADVPLTCGCSASEPRRHVHPGTRACGPAVRE
jgi:hypothetical protein